MLVQIENTPKRQIKQLESFYYTFYALHNIMYFSKMFIVTSVIAALIFAVRMYCPLCNKLYDRMTSLSRKESKHCGKRNKDADNYGFSFTLYVLHRIKHCNKVFIKIFYALHNMYFSENVHYHKCYYCAYNYLKNVLFFMQ